MTAGYIGTIPAQGYALHFVPARFRYRFLANDGRIARRAESDLYSPTGRECLLKRALKREAEPQPNPYLRPELRELLERASRICTRPDCTEKIQSTDLRRKVCDECRTS